MHSTDFLSASLLKMHSPPHTSYVNCAILSHDVIFLCLENIAIYFTLLLIRVQVINYRNKWERSHKLEIAITYGTFDTFHIGHLNLLKNIRSRCKKLIVGVSTDEFNEDKGKKTLVPFEQRLAIVSAIRYVDVAIAEHNWDQKVQDIQAHGVTSFYIGDDWAGKFDHLNSICAVHYLPRTLGISSTVLKEKIGDKTKSLKVDIADRISEIEKLILELPE